MVFQMVRCSFEWYFERCVALLNGVLNGILQF